MTTRPNPRRRRVQARAVDFAQSPLGIGGATFASIGLVDVIGHLGPNGILAASLAGIATFFFRDELLMLASKATGRTFISDEAVDTYAREQGLLPAPEEEKIAPPPQVYRYEDISDQIPANRLLLGVHPESGELELTKWIKLKCLWIVGTSSTGKSNTAYGKAHQAVSNGALLLVVDQHINKADSLGKKLLAFESSFLRPIAVTDEEVLATLDFYEDEFNRRVAGGSCKKKIVLICDEMNRMARNERLLKRLKEIVAICGEESRGFGMYGWFISQRAVHLKWLRDAATTVIAHRMVRVEEARLACNDDLKAARKNLKYPIGRTWVYGVEFEDLELQQEWYEVKDDQDDEDEDWEMEDDGPVADEEEVSALRRLASGEYLHSYPDEDHQDDQDLDEYDAPILPTRNALRVTRIETMPKNEQKKDVTRNVPEGWTEEDVMWARRLYKNLNNRDQTLKALGKATSQDNRRILTAILQEQGEEQ